MGKDPKKFGRQSSRPTTSLASALTDLFSEEALLAAMAQEAAATAVAPPVAPPAKVVKPKATAKPKTKKEKPVVPEEGTTPPAGNRPLRKLADGRTTPFTAADVTPPDGILADLWDFTNVKSNVYSAENTPSYNKKLDKDMELIYDMQGFHAQPAVYDTEEELINSAKKKGFLLNGNPMIMSRTVPVVRWAEPLFGVGKHYVHSKPGYWGSGTYWMGEAQQKIYDPATQDATTKDYSPKSWYKAAQKSNSMYGSLSAEYSGSQAPILPTDIKKATTHLGYLKRDAKSNLAAITNEKGNFSQKMFKEWSKGLQKEFRATFGKDHPNLGVMASMLGYDAIHIPSTAARWGGETLVFNRGATGVSKAEWKYSSKLPEGV